jgi:hypothetical protein
MTRNKLSAFMLAFIAGVGLFLLFVKYREGRHPVPAQILASEVAGDTATKFECEAGDCTQIYELPGGRKANEGISCSSTAEEETSFIMSWLIPIAPLTKEDQEFVDKTARDPRRGIYAFPTIDRINLIVSVRGINDRCHYFITAPSVKDVLEIEGRNSVIFQTYQEKVARKPSARRH